MQLWVLRDGNLRWGRPKKWWCNAFLIARNRVVEKFKEILCPALGHKVGLKKRPRVCRTRQRYGSVVIIMKMLS